MKKLILGLFLLTFIDLFAQKMPSDYFDEGLNYVENEDYKNALLSFQYITKNHPKNDLYPRSVYNIGYIYYVDNQYDSAISVFKTILVSRFNENENSGGGIMDNPYANYRHNASSLLSDIYYKQKNYDTALYYLGLSDTVYPYLHFCGNESAGNDIQIALRYNDLYQILGNKNKAIESLLPTVLINLANNSEVLSQLKSLLQDRKDLKQILDNAISEIYSKSFKGSNVSYKEFYFKFLNVEIAVPHGYEDDDQKFDKDNAIKEIKSSAFYNMIKSI